MFGKKIEVKSPLEGTIVPLSSIKDEAFASGVLGRGAAIVPGDGRVFSPVDGTVDSVADAKHAVNLVGDRGEEIMIHLGMDTVSLKGKPFTLKVKAGDRVKAGDLLMEADLGAIAASGLETVTPVVVLNTADYRNVVCASGTVKPGDPLLTIKV